MIRTGILNPHLLSLLARTRHTNRIVIADRGFPSWAGLETIDLSLVDGVPTVLQVVDAIRANHVIGNAWMAQEFLDNNTPDIVQQFAQSFAGIRLMHKPHVEFKKLVPDCIGLIRTGETIQYANLILESA
jgi:D-ribose pyranase